MNGIIGDDKGTDATSKNETKVVNENETSLMSDHCQVEYEQTAREPCIKHGQTLQSENQNPGELRSTQGLEFSGNKKITTKKSPNQCASMGKIKPENIRTCDSSVVKSRFKLDQFQISLAHQENRAIQHFKGMREKSFIILLGIVLIFLICNIPRLLVKVFIILSEGEGKAHFEYCLKNNRLPVPAFIIIMGRYILNTLIISDELTLYYIKHFNLI